MHYQALKKVQMINKSLKNIIEERLFSSEAIKNNFFGMTHSNASSLISPNIGVVGLLEQSGNNFSI